MKNTKMNMVLEHLKKHGSITSWEAITKYSVTRLSAVIFALKKSHNIESVRIPKPNGEGNQHFCRYIYKGAKEE